MQAVFKNPYVSLNSKMCIRYGGAAHSGIYQNPQAAAETTTTADSAKGVLTIRIAVTAHHRRRWSPKMARATIERRLSRGPTPQPCVLAFFASKKGTCSTMTSNDWVSPFNFSTVPTATSGRI